MTKRPRKPAKANDDSKIVGGLTQAARGAAVVVRSPIHVDVVQGPIYPPPGSRLKGAVKPKGRKPR